MGNGALAQVLRVDAELLGQLQALDLIASPLAQLEFQDGNAVLHHAAVVIEAAAHDTTFLLVVNLDTSSQPEKYML